MSPALIRGYDNRYALSDLWGQAFGDDSGFIADMYANGYLRPSDIFAMTDDGRLVAALFLPEYRIRIGGEDSPIRLLSCVATDSSQRGKGYMSRMIPRVLELVRHECAGVCVIPVSESLYSFYERFGFSTAFYVSEQVFTPNDVSSPFNFIASKTDPASFYEIYLSKYKKDGCVFKTGERFLQAVAEYRHPTQPCDFVQGEAGFAFVQRDSSELVVREWAGFSAPNLAAALISRYGLPVRIQDIPGEGELKPIAMLCSFDESLSDFAKEHRLYLNCMYN